jgi:hypothetical protein
MGRRNRDKSRFNDGFQERTYLEMVQDLEETRERERERNARMKQLREENELLRSSLGAATGAIPKRVEVPSGVPEPPVCYATMSTPVVAPVQTSTQYSSVHSQPLFLGSGVYLHYTTSGPTHTVNSRPFSTVTTPIFSGLI